MRAVFCLSLDFELILGWHDLDSRVYRRKQLEMADIRERVLSLIDLLESRELKSTWATVAHLMLPGCRGHDDYPVEGWLARDPASSAAMESLWYAPDLIERLLGSRVDFEIACHSFSHALFDSIGPEQAEYELSKSLEVAADWGISLRSFVFPRNRVGYLEQLAKKGFEAYRPAAAKSKPLTSVGKAWNFLVGTHPAEPQIPAVRSGLVAVPPSFNLGRFAPRYKRWLSQAPPRDFRRWALRVGLDHTVRQGGVFHVWMHPAEWGLTVTEDDLSYLLDLVDQHRARGSLEVLTMGEIARLTLDQTARPGASSSAPEPFEGGFMP